MGTKTSPHYFYLFDMLPFLINDSTGFSVDQLVNCWEACWSSVVVWWVESYLWWIYSAFSASVHSHQSFYFTNYISAWLLTSWSLPCFPPYFSTLVFSSLILSFFYLIYSLVVLFIISFNHFLSSSISILIYKFLYSSYPPIIPSFLSSFLSSFHLQQALLGYQSCSSWTFAERYRFHALLAMFPKLLLKHLYYQVMHHDTFCRHRRYD